MLNILTLSELWSCKNILCILFYSFAVNMIMVLVTSQIIFFYVFMTYDYFFDAYLRRAKLIRNYTTHKKYFLRRSAS